MNFLILNGPNLNLLGLREPAVYGTRDYAALIRFVQDACREAGVTCEDFQSNHEGIRQISYAGMACVKTYMGLGFDGYREAIFFLKEYLQKNAQARP